MKQEGKVISIKERTTSYVIKLEGNEKFFSGWGKPLMKIGDNIKFDYIEKLSNDKEITFNNIQKVEIVSKKLEANTYNEDDKVIAFVGISLLELAKKLSTLNTKATQVFQNGKGYEALVYLK